MAWRHRRGTEAAAPRALTIGWNCSASGGRTMAEPPIGSNAWTICKTIGRTTGQESEIPIHLDFR